MTRETLGSAPGPGSPTRAFGEFIHAGYGLPEDYTVAGVIRHGGRAGTGLTVLIQPPGEGGPIRISYTRESDCMNPNRLRAQAAADTRGLTRGSLITQKSALAMYEAMCSMAAAFDMADDAASTWEWVQVLRQDAAVVDGDRRDYRSLLTLRQHRYSRKLVTSPDPMLESPRPMLLHTHTGDYITARHMAVFLRYDLGVEDAGSDDQIITRLEKIGGERIVAQEWDRPGRDRQRKVRLVLYRLPEDDRTED